MCNLINKPHIKILIVIYEIHQFRLHFSHGVLPLRSLDILSLVRYTAYRVWDVFRVLLGRTFVFGLHTKKPKNLKKLKNLIKKNLF